MGLAELAVQAAQEFSKPQATIVQFVNKQAPVYSFDPATGEEYRRGKRTEYRQPQSETHNIIPDVVIDPFFEDAEEGMYHLTSEYHHGIDNATRLRHYSLAQKSFWEDGSFFDMVPVDYRAIGTPVHGFTPHQKSDGWQTLKEEKKPASNQKFVFDSGF